MEKALPTSGEAKLGIEVSVLGSVEILRETQPQHSMGLCLTIMSEVMSMNDRCVHEW